MSIGRKLASSRTGAHPITPYNIPGLAYWFDPTRHLGSFTYGAAGAVTSTGTTPPILTLTGTCANAINLRVEITTGGARGTAVFRISFDGGATYYLSNITTAATTGPYNGITLSWAVGTYTNDNVYKAATTIASAPSREALNNIIDATKTVTQPTVTFRPELSLFDPAFNNQHVINCVGTHAPLASSTWASTVTYPHTFYLVCNATANQVANQFAVVCNAPNGEIFFDTSNKLGYYNGTIVTTPGAFADSVVRVYCFTAQTALIGNSSIYASDSTTPVMTGASGNGGIGINSIIIGAASVAGSQKLVGKIGTVLLYTGMHDQPTRFSIMQYLGNLYGLAYS